ncbi:hypothetical protein KKG51_01630, partial [Patescibacteria group bacterium]|nr:hypothetical protein [Patescibacteria group bacterium]
LKFKMPKKLPIDPGLKQEHTGTTEGGRGIFRFTYTLSDMNKDMYVNEFLRVNNKTLKGI